MDWNSSNVVLKRDRWIRVNASTLVLGFEKTVFKVFKHLCDTRFTYWNVAVLKLWQLIESRQE